MGWEWRGTAGPYLYVKERQGDQVVSRYVGRGEVAQAIAEMTAQDQRDRDRHREDRDRAEQETAAAFAALRDLDRLADAAMRAVLTEAGYRQHARGAWRKRRHDHDPAA